MMRFPRFPRCATAIVLKTELPKLQRQDFFGISSRSCWRTRCPIWMCHYHFEVPWCASCASSSDIESMQTQILDICVTSSRAYPHVKSVYGTLDNFTWKVVEDPPNKHFLHLSPCSSPNNPNNPTRHITFHSLDIQTEARYDMEPKNIPIKHGKPQFRYSPGCLGQHKQCIFIREIPLIYHTFVLLLT